MYCRLPDGSLMEIAKVYPLDAVYDTPDDVPEDVKLIVDGVFIVILLPCFLSNLFLFLCCRLKPINDMLELQTGLLRLTIMFLLPLSSSINAVL